MRKKANLNQHTTQILDPGLDGLGRVGLLDVLERLVQEHVARWRVTLQHDAPIAQALLAHALLLELDATAQRQLYENAAAQATRYAVVPERGVTLLLRKSRRVSVSEFFVLS